MPFSQEKKASGSPPPPKRDIIQFPTIVIETIVAYRRQYPILLFFALLASIYSAVCGCIIPLILRKVYNDLLGPGDIYVIVLFLSIMGLALSLLVGADVILATCAAKIAVRLTNYLRFKMFKKIQFVNLNTEENKESELFTNFTNDIEQVEFVLSHTLWGNIRSFFFIIPGIILLFNFNWEMALLFILLTPVTIAFPRFASQKTAALYKSNQKQQTSIINMVQESLSLQTIVLLLGLTLYRRKIYKNRIKQLAQSKATYHTLIELISRYNLLSLNLIRFIIICLGIYMVIAHRLTLGGLIGFLELIASLNFSIGTISANFPILLQGAISLNRVLSFLHEPLPHQDEKEIKSKEDFNRLTHSIRFSNVNFRYKNRQILKNINLEILPNQYVAFIGASGSGKSTILKLILQEERPQSGQILFDDQDITTIRRAALLAQEGIVLQNPMLFNTSVYENIRMGKLDATRDEIIAAAKLAEVHEDILNFSEGYDTKVGMHSRRLSGGQAQRISIARALVNKPAILFLDEATSGLDLINATAIDETLLNITRHCTIISITHRLSAVTHADKIFVVDNGCIVESGTHKELLDKHGFYEKLWTKQHAVKLSEDAKEASVDPKWLKAIPFFSMLNDEALNFLSTQFSIERMEAGKIVFDEGDRGEKFYVIAAGTVEVFHLENGTRKSIVKLTDGDFFGEIALLYDRPRSARIVTRSVSIFLVLHHHQFIEIFKKLPPDLQKSFKSIAAEREKEILSEFGKEKL